MRANINLSTRFIMLASLDEEDRPAAARYNLRIAQAELRRAQDVVSKAFQTDSQYALQPRPGVWIWEYCHSTDPFTIYSQTGYASLEELKGDVGRAFGSLHTWEEIELRGQKGTAILVKWGDTTPHRFTGHWAYRSNSEVY